MNQILANLEGNVEEQEQKIEKLNSEKKKIQTTEEKISNTISRLEYDAAIAQNLENKLQKTEKDREELECKKVNLKNEMESVLIQINHEEEVVNQSLNALSDLESMGENVNDAKQIYQERLNTLDNLRRRMDAMAQKLDSMPKTDSLSDSLRKIEEHNRMIDESVRKHGEMARNHPFLPGEEMVLDHQIYRENGEKAKQEFIEYMKQKDPALRNMSSIEIDNRIKNLRETETRLKNLTSIRSVEIKDLNISDDTFWSYKSTSKEKYLDMASKLPEVERELKNGKSLEEIRQNKDLKDTADAYYGEKNAIIIEVDADGYHYQADGRHRIAAARELGIDIPVKFVKRG